MDLFSEEFKIKLSKNTQKKETGCGKCLSIFIIIISLAYFVYLIEQYATDKLLPRVTNGVEQQISSNYTFTQSPLRYGMRYTPQRLVQHFGGDMQKVQEFLSPQTQALNGQAFYFNEATLQMDRIAMVPCPEHPVSKPDPSAPFQFCLDIANNPYVYANNTGGDFSLYFMTGKCQLFKEEADCPDRSAIDLMLTEPTLMFYFDILVDTYDTKNEKPIESLQRKYITPDLNNVEFIQIQLQQTTTSYDNQFLIKNTKNVTQVSDYRMEQTTLSNQIIFQKWKEMFKIKQEGDVLMMLKINIDLPKKVISVEYVKLSELIAMFLGIFNALMAIGFLGKMVSEAVLTEDLMEHQLTQEYKRTAYEIDQQNKKFGKEGYLIKNDVSLKALIFSIKNNYFPAKKDTVAPELEQDYAGIREEEQYKQKKQILYQALQQDCENKLNIAHLKEDIIHVLQFMQLMLSKDQYAALMNCGKRIPALISENDSTKNHLEEIEQLQNNPTLQSKLIQEQFLPRVQQSKSNLSELDKKLYQCLLESYKEKEKSDSDDKQSLGIKNTNEYNQNDDVNIIIKSIGNIDDQDTVENGQHTNIKFKKVELEDEEHHN